MDLVSRLFKRKSKGYGKDTRILVNNLLEYIKDMPPMPEKEGQASKHGTGRSIIDNLKKYGVSYDVALVIISQLVMGDHDIAKADYAYFKYLKEVYGKK